MSVPFFWKGNQVSDDSGNSNGSVWCDAELLFSAPQATSVAFSKAGNDFAAVFEKGTFQLQLEPKTGPLSLTQTVSLRTTVNVPQDMTLFGFVQELSFGVTRTAGIRVLIQADLGGTVETIELDYETGPYGQTISEPETFSLIIRRGFNARPTRFGSVPGASQDYVATITVTIQRRDLGENGIVSISGLDLSANLVPAATTSGKASTSMARS